MVILDSIGLFSSQYNEVIGGIWVIYYLLQPNLHIWHQRPANVKKNARQAVLITHLCYQKQQLCADDKCDCLCVDRCVCRACLYLHDPLV